MHSFNTECSIPPEGTNWVSSPNTRGTLDILWSCLTVVILCTWSAIDLNVPAQDNTEKEPQKTLCRLKRLRLKVGWMVFNILVPEWVLAKAVLDWISVRKLKESYRKQAKVDKVPFSNMHIHFANLGGFGISFDGIPRLNQDDTPNASGSNRVTQVSTYTPDSSNDAEKCLSQTKADAQGWQIDTDILKLLNTNSPEQSQAQKFTLRDASQRMLILKANLWVLNASQLLEARDIGIIARLPDIDEQDLKDRDKSSVLIKALAASQTCWFGFQFLTRFGNSQTNTQLEITVFAIAVCSVAAYGFAWDRPKDITYTVRLKAVRRPTTIEELERIARKASLPIMAPNSDTIWNSSGCVAIDEGLILRIPTDIFSAGAPYVITCAFGALHCIAWDSVFPTEIEHTMWRVSSLVMTFVPMVFVLSQAYLVRYKSERHKLHKLVGILKTWRVKSTYPLWQKLLILGALFVSFLSILVFLAARLFTIVEVFRSLGFQPRSAFETTTWTNYLPHIG